MMYDTRRRKPEPTFLLTQGIFNLPHHTGMVCEELVCGEMDCSTGNGYGIDRIRTPVTRITNPVH